LAAPMQQPAERERQKAPAATMADRGFGQSKEELDGIKPSDSAKAMTGGKTRGAFTYQHGPRAMQNQMQNQAQNQVQNNGLPMARTQAPEAKRLDEFAQADGDWGTLALNVPTQEALAKKTAAPTAPPPAPTVVGGAAGSGARAQANKAEAGVQ